MGRKAGMLLVMPNRWATSMTFWMPTLAAS